jgi:hypothetical protein
MMTYPFLPDGLYQTAAMYHNHFAATLRDFSSEEGNSLPADPAPDKRIRYSAEGNTYFVAFAAGTYFAWFAVQTLSDVAEMHSADFAVAIARKRR